MFREVGTHLGPLSGSSDSIVGWVKEMLTAEQHSPTTPGLYMFMLCYKNGVSLFAPLCTFWVPHAEVSQGGLAREQIRDALPSNPAGISDQWSHFNHHAMHTHPLGVSIENSAAKIGLYFPRPEIVPNVKAGTYRYTYTGEQPTVCSPSAWKLPEDDCRAIIESQLLSLRLRSRGIVAPPSPNLKNVPAQPRRVYLVGGGSQNAAIAKLAGEILGGVEGVVSNLFLTIISLFIVFWGPETFFRLLRQVF